MILRRFFLLTVSLILAGSLASCESSTSPNAADTSGLIRSTDRAVFVVNEGAHSDGSMDVIVYHNAVGQKLDTVVYRNVLSGLGEGNDVLINGKQALVLDAGGNTLYMVRIDSLIKTASVSFGLTQPNKMALIGPDMLLVTRRGSNSAAIVDIAKQQIVDSIVIAEPSIAVAVLNNKAYVTSGSFGATGHVNVVNLTTRKVQKSVPVVTGAEAIVADSGSSQFLVESLGDYANVKPMLYWFNGVSDQLKDSVIASQTGIPSLIGGRKVFLVDGGKISQIDMTQHTIDAPVISGTDIFYQGAYNAGADELYLGISDFSSVTGKVRVYDAVSGAFKASFTTGIAPAHFAFYN